MNALNVLPIQTDDGNDHIMSERLSFLKANLNRIDHQFKALGGLRKYIIYVIIYRLLFNEKF